MIKMIADKLKTLNIEAITKNITKIITSYETQERQRERSRTYTSEKK